MLTNKFDPTPYLRNSVVVPATNATSATNEEYVAGVAAIPTEMRETQSVAAWINTHPPELPEHQNNCAACGEFIPVYDVGWVILGDGALVHIKCRDRWSEMRRGSAKQSLDM